jgi:hypothetical protein
MIGPKFNLITIFVLYIINICERVAITVSFIVSIVPVDAVTIVTIVMLIS